MLPIMPLLVKDLGITQAQFGTVVAAFGLAKLLANVPAAILTDSKGRRFMMVLGLGFVGAGMGVSP